MERVLITVDVYEEDDELQAVIRKVDEEDICDDSISLLLQPGQHGIEELLTEMRKLLKRVL